jgi:hypothetical protein
MLGPASLTAIIPLVHFTPRLFGDGNRRFQTSGKFPDFHVKDYQQ